MCRKNQMIGALAAGFGLGLLIAGCFESMFFCSCIGAVLLVVGFLLFTRK